MLSLQKMNVSQCNVLQSNGGTTVCVCVCLSQERSSEAHGKWVCLHCVQKARQLSHCTESLALKSPWNQDLCLSCFTAHRRAKPPIWKIHFFENTKKTCFLAECYLLRIPNPYYKTHKVQIHVSPHSSGPYLHFDICTGLHFSVSIWTNITKRKTIRGCILMLCPIINTR